MCNCKVLKSFDDDYHICLCGHLFPINKTEQPSRPIISTAPQKKTIGPNTLRAVEIHASVALHLEAIIEMRRYQVGWMSVIKSLDIVGTPSTVAKHYDAILLESQRIVELPAINRYNNAGVKRRQHKQEGIKFGARV